MFALNKQPHHDKEKRTMTISEYLSGDERTYKYVGTIWGDEPGVFTGSEMAAQLETMGYGEGEIVDDADDDGYYIVGDGTITYKNGSLVQETVLELVE
jgi:hypothetical protein